MSRLLFAAMQNSLMVSSHVKGGPAGPFNSAVRFQTISIGAKLVSVRIAVYSAVLALRSALMSMILPTMVLLSSPIIPSLLGIASRLNVTTSPISGEVL